MQKKKKKKITTHYSKFVRCTDTNYWSCWVFGHNAVKWSGSLKTESCLFQIKSSVLKNIKQTCSTRKSLKVFRKGLECRGLRLSLSDFTVNYFKFLFEKFKDLVYILVLSEMGKIIICWWFKIKIKSPK